MPSRVRRLGVTQGTAKRCCIIEPPVSVFGKVARSLAPDHECSDDLVCAYQRHNKARSIASPHRDLSDRAWRLVAYIGNLLRLSGLRRLADRIGSAEVLALHSCNRVFAKTIRGPQAKQLLHLVESVDGT